jgi:heptosyltransferase-3
MNMPMLHMAHYHLLLLNRYGLSVNAKWPRLHINEGLAGIIKNLLEQEKVPSDIPLIAIQPFSLWRYKEWGSDKFRQLVQRLMGTHDVGILICGAKSERPRVDQMMGGITMDNVFNMAGRTTIDQYAALLACCRLFIGCDSAGVHLAAAVATPTATIYGPSSPKSWAPREQGHVVIRKAMDCVPCRQKGCHDSGLSKCLESLSVDEVIAEIEPLIAALGMT